MLRAVRIRAAVAVDACRGFASSVRPAQGEVYKQLEMFPELKESVDACRQHQYARAVPPLTRMLQVCDSISPALATEAAWELGKVHARLGQVEQAAQQFKRDVVHGPEQTIRMWLAHGRRDLALPLAASLPSPKKELYTSIAQLFSHEPLSNVADEAEAVTKAHAAALLVAQSSHQLDTETLLLPKVLAEDDAAAFKDAESLFLAAIAAAGGDATESHFVASLYANLGELYLASDRTEDAMNILGKALKLEESLNEPVDLARTLGLLAVGYHRLGQAVSSEGLFASSLEKFATAPHLNRVHTIVYAKTLVGYSQLLQQWEKREADGATKLASAKALLEGESRDAWLSLVYLGL
ncbi:Aste57867_1665 [Aphanomyces stellatus]|uniref:Aste57867_1665 protein n=1 Tax=Aphanomyces stellatus TaxID=120398 RepID=A0A485KAW8_9STRA|nr:hypothetical protein As57867_001663 [Aphanomyces stellatus]VFT78877.1 Aste57867_1665 [Aphanomyces stellatus]